MENHYCTSDYIVNFYNILIKCWGLIAKDTKHLELSNSSFERRTNTNLEINVFFFLHTIH